MAGVKNGRPAITSNHQEPERHRPGADQPGDEAFAQNPGQLHAANI